VVLKHLYFEWGHFTTDGFNVLLYEQVQEQTIFGGQRIFLPNFPNISRKKIYERNFHPAKFLQLLVHYIFVCHVAIYLKTQNLVVEIGS